MSSFLVTFVLTLLASLSIASNDTLLRRSCINADCSALRITISHPPVNLFDHLVVAELNAFLLSLQNQNTTKSVVFSSDTPGFFAAHLDLDLFSPTTTPPNVNATAVLNQCFANLDLFLSTPVIFIAEINGRTWGAGNENIMHMDMRFAGPGAVFSAPEAAGGLIHVGGIQQLVQLIGPALTMEYALSAAQVSAFEAARIGWVNSDYSSASDLRGHVDALATRIALFDIGVIRAHKESIARQAPPRQFFEADLALFNYLATLPSTQAKIARLLSGTDNQTTPVEYEFDDDFVRLLYQ